MGMRLTRSTVILVLTLMVVIAEYVYLAYLRGLLNLREAVTLVVAELAVAAILFALSRIFGRDTDELPKKFALEKQKLEEIDRDGRNLHEAIKEWIQPLPVPWQIGGERLYLAERVPRYAQKVYDCLSRNYPEIWADLQKYRAKYGELTALKTGKIPEEFWESGADTATLRYDSVLARKNFNTAPIGRNANSTSSKNESGNSR
jgi:hypothetical protein